MNLWQSVRASLALLDPRSRRILALLVVVQFLLALLDFIGVILIGLVAALSASAVSGEPPGPVVSVLEILGLENEDTLTVAVGFAIAAGSLFILKSVLSFLITRRSYRFLAHRQALIAGRLVSLLLARSILDVYKRSSQETSYALTYGVNSATLGVLGSSVTVGTEISVIVVIVAAMLAVDVFVAIFSIAFFAIIALLLHRVLANWASQLGLQLSFAEISSVVAVQESIRTYREIVVSGRRGFYADKFQELRWKAAQVQADITIMSQVSKYVFEIALIVGAALLAFTQYLTKDLVASIAVIAVFLAATSRITPALLRLQASLLTIRSASGVAQTTIDLAQELEVVPSDHSLNAAVIKRVRENATMQHDQFSGNVSVQCASFTYPSAQRNALNAISLEVPAGSSLALVGPTGAGKSTMVDLILGVLDPDKGSVTIAGLEPSEAISTFPGALAYVPQDIAVIDGTIRSNVAVGLPSDIVDDNQVWRALTRAQLDGFLQREREGIDTVVGENGVRLSGGQRQRLGLARALYTNPKLLVLDEATSALDAETERAVSDTLDALDKEVTRIIVAHRLATIRHCDQVAYLEDGRLVAIGVFEEVRRQVPNFDRQAQLLGL